MIKYLIIKLMISYTYYLYTTSLSLSNMYEYYILLIISITIEKQFTHLVEFKIGLEYLIYSDYCLIRAE